MQNRAGKRDSKWRKDNANKTANQKQQHHSRNTVNLAYNISDPTAKKEYQMTLRKNRKQSPQ